MRAQASLGVQRSNAVRLSRGPTCSLMHDGHYRVCLLEKTAVIKR